MPHKSFTDAQSMMEYEFDNIKMPRRKASSEFIPFVGPKGVPDNHVSTNPEYMNDTDISRRHKDYGKPQKYTVNHDLQVGEGRDKRDNNYTKTVRHK